MAPIPSSEVSSKLLAFLSFQPPSDLGPRHRFFLPRPVAVALWGLSCSRPSKLAKTQAAPSTPAWSSWLLCCLQKKAWTADRGFQSPLTFFSRHVACTPQLHCSVPTPTRSGILPRPSSFLCLDGLFLALSNSFTWLKAQLKCCGVCRAGADFSQLRWLCSMVGAHGS